MNLKDVSQAIDKIAKKHELKLLYTDHTDTTLIARLGFSIELFIQIYANVKKEKLNMSLVVTGERIYGIDKEGGFYHEHPFENPSLHGVWANGKTVEECRRELVEVLEEWLILKIKDKDPVPVVKNINLNIKEVASA